MTIQAEAEEAEKEAEGTTLARDMVFVSRILIRFIISHKQMRKKNSHHKSTSQSTIETLRPLLFSCGIQFILDSIFDSTDFIVIFEIVGSKS